MARQPIKSRPLLGRLAMKYSPTARARASFTRSKSSSTSAKGRASSAHPARISAAVLKCQSGSRPPRVEERQKSKRPDAAGSIATRRPGSAVRRRFRPESARQRHRPCRVLLRRHCASSRVFPYPIGAWIINTGIFDDTRRRSSRGRTTMSLRVRGGVALRATTASSSLAGGTMGLFTGGRKRVQALALVPVSANVAVPSWIADASSCVIAVLRSVVRMQGLFLIR